MSASTTARHLRLAGLVLIGSLAVVFLPLVLDLGVVNKYIVALGLFWMCIGMSFGLNALIDLVIRRR
jgi:hypothetical protein